MALIGRPFDEGIALAQIEDVILVNPRRQNQQGAFELFGGSRHELNQLEHRVFKHHLARRAGDVFTELESTGVGHPHAQLACGFVNVLE